MRFYRLLLRADVPAIKRFRRFATRYGQTASNCATLIFVAATMLALE